MSFRHGEENKAAHSEQFNFKRRLTIDTTEKLGLRAFFTAAAFIGSGFNPVVAGFVWKGIAVATAGSAAVAVAHLIPFAGAAADGAGLLADAASTASDFTDAASGISDVHTEALSHGNELASQFNGGVGDENIHGGRPTDIHGNTLGGTVWGPKTDPYGNPTI